MIKCFDNFFPFYENRFIQKLNNLDTFLKCFFFSHWQFTNIHAIFLDVYKFALMLNNEFSLACK